MKYDELIKLIEELPETVEEKESLYRTDNMKPYKCHDPIGPGKTVNAPTTCCLFCKNCTDVYWDYSHGPYMMICIKHDDVFDCGGAGGTCKDFEEDKK